MRPLPIVALFCFAVGIAPSFALPSTVVPREKQLEKKKPKDRHPSPALKGKGAQPSEPKILFPKVEDHDEPKESGSGVRKHRPVLRRPSKGRSSTLDPIVEESA
ncbi:hypothetical protein F5148DRAFT_1269628 [Russula earlei]|uniref:Uncharacterized protein n=1 Tax=Russula earlei TaxID=71964 RepID=A0ACC0TQQ7_9AGAM|nr:hypothetical protein F5148DRAFT_1269628 [Russula earlei]